MWRKWGDYAIVNFTYPAKDIDRVAKQNGYSISKALSQGVWIYELWKLPDIHMGKFQSADEAKDYLSNYLNDNPEK